MSNLALPYYLGTEESEMQIKYIVYGTKYEVCLSMNLAIIVGITIEIDR